MSGMNPFNNPFGSHPHIQMGTPVQSPAPSMGGTPQEEIRNQIMQRVGQYGPQPLHRVRGAIGGQNPTLDKAEWKLLLRDDQWHEDATGPFNANFKTLVTLGPPVYYSSGSSAGVGLRDNASNALGVIAKVSFGVGGTTNSELLFDVPAGGMVHVPFCGETVIAHVAVEAKILTTTQMNAGLWIPDKPFLSIPDPTNSHFPATHYPQASGAIVPGQGLATNPVNMPTRQIGMILDASGDTGTVPIPRGTQAVQVFGPADMVVTMNAPTTNVPLSVPVTAGRITPLFSNAVGITTESPADGGLATFYFYLGI